jgi:hypothetical protein
LTLEDFMNHRMRTPLLAALFIFLAANPSTASVIKDTVLYCNSGSSCTTLSQSATGPASATASLFGGTVSGSADASGGVLHAYSSFSLPLPASLIGQVNGDAEFFDTITINATGMAGSTGYVVFSTGVDGIILGSGQGFVAAFLNCTTGTGNNCQTQNIFGSGTNEITFAPIAFTFGTPFNFEFALGAVTYYGPGGAVSSTADFSNTAVLNGIGVYTNSNGTGPVSNVTFISADGVTYTTNGIVPEPGSQSLLLVGLVLLGRVAFKGDRSET